MWMECNKVYCNNLCTVYWLLNTNSSENQYCSEILPKYSKMYFECMFEHILLVLKITIMATSLEHSTDTKGSYNIKTLLYSIHPFII